MAKEAIPYPDLPDTPANDPSVTRAQFWRAAWLRDLAEAEAFQRVADAQRRLKRTDLITCYALSAAESALTGEAKKSLTTLIEAGGLLYAWAPDTKRGCA
jgi:hypothetical protein